MSSSALKAAATGQVQQRPKTILDFLGDKRVADGIAAVAGRFLTPDRMLRLCVNAVKKTPKLMDCDPQTVLGAMMTSAALGLEPNTIQQQAFLIPYKKRAKVGQNWVDVYDCQFQVGARGFITLGYRSPHIRSMSSGAIHDRDLFEHMEGSQSFLKYAVQLRGGRGDLIGAFSHVVLESGREEACVLPLDELMKIRDKSETFRALVRNIETAENQKEREKAERNLAETPWVMWIDDMASKSAIKKHAKRLPIATGDALATAAELDNRGDAGQMDLRAMTDPDMVRAVMADEAEPPALENKPSEALPVSGEAFGTAQRQAVPAQQEQQQGQPQPQQQRPAAKRARAAGPGAAEAQPALTANDYIARIDDAADAESASALLAQAKNAGLAADQLQLVVEAHGMAWTNAG